MLEDPGVAVYFTRKKRQIAIGCDHYLRPWENVRAIGKAIEAFRAMERHGAHQVLDQAFTGFSALPPPEAMSPASDRAWWIVPGVPHDAGEAEIRAAYKARVREAGGASVELNAAKEAGLAARRT